MELGEKIRQARLEAGLSQRQLCGEEITRNMLSLIENGAAKPSMKTLGYLAKELGKPLSWFVDEYGTDHRELISSAENLRLAQEAAAQGKDIYAAQLLENVTSPLLLREKLLLMGLLPGSSRKEVCRMLPSLDGELLLRAEAALETGAGERCRKLLDAVEDTESVRWNLLKGKLELSQGRWEAAAECLEKAEEEGPEVIGMLETCFRELGDFRRAYEYACKQR